MKKIIIIGANNFQLPLIIKAKEMNLETHVFAWEKGAVGKKHADHFYPISITEKEKILEEAKRIEPNGVISIASDLASITVNFLAHNLGLLGNSLQSTQMSTNKYTMRQKLREYNLPCPKFIKTDDLEDINSFDYPLIVKPTDRSGSRGVKKVINKDELNAAIERAKRESFASECIVEEFVEGKEYSVEFISWKGGHHFLQITEKETTGFPYYVESGQHQPANLSEELKLEIISLVSKALTALEIEYGASHTEIIIDNNNKIFFVEVGARMGGDYIGSHLVKLSTGYDFLENVINISLGAFNNHISLENKYYSGIYYIIPKPGKLISIVDNSKDYSEIISSEIYYDIGDYIGEVQESNDRAGCYIYQSEKGKFKHNSKILDLITRA